MYTMENFFGNEKAMMRKAEKTLVAKQICSMHEVGLFRSNLSIHLETMTALRKNTTK